MLELCSQLASSLRPVRGRSGRVKILGACQVVFQRWTAGSGIAVWIKRRSGCEGCHVVCFMGEWWIRMSMAVPVLRDQIQTVVGKESVRVARRVPSLLIAITETPCVGLFDLPRDKEVGGLAGCGAAT